MKLKSIGLAIAFTVFVLFVFELILLFFNSHSSFRQYPSSAYSKAELSTPSPIHSSGMDSVQTNSMPSRSTSGSSENGSLSSLHIAVPIQSESIATYFNSFARPLDIGAVLSRNSAGLSLITSGRKALIFDSWVDAESQINSLHNRISIIGYDPEHWPQTPQDEQTNLPATLQKASQDAHANGMKLLVAPDRQFDHEYLCQIAPYTDILILQAQRLQDNQQAFSSWVSSMTKSAKQANPKIQVFVQVITSSDSNTIVSDLETVSHDVDGVSIWTSPQTLSVLEEVVSAIRK